MRRFISALFLALVMVACADAGDSRTNKSSAGDFLKIEGSNGSTKYGALSVDPSTGKTADCKLTDLPMLGPNGQGKVCDRATKKWALVLPDDACTYPDDVSQDLQCTWISCKSASECDDNNPNTTDACEFSQQSLAKGGGSCYYYWASCTVAEGTPCAASGYKSKDDGSCDVAADMSKASTELCDNVDNDCNGKTDDGKNIDGSDFNIGKVCDGNDNDKCANGTWTCAKGGMGSECINETKSIVEACDGEDNDCNGVIDDKWPTLGQACDGEDADACKLGKLVCNETFSNVMCSETGMNKSESCNGADDTCEGKTDEGCDDDGDLYCDSSMQMLKGALCSKSSVPSDNSSKAGDDCADNEKAINPGASELCDSVDNNCAGGTDEGYSLNETCVSTLKDGTSDGVCNTKGKFAKCSVDGMNAVCDAVSDMSKAVTEICDAVDNDCDGKTDEGCDDDGDGFCDSGMKMAKAAKCTKSNVPADNGVVDGDDCADTEKAVNPGASESCNGVDDNCDTKKDEGCDDDGDGFCDKAMAFADGATCKQGEGGKGDCNDADKAINPSATEICDNVDNNCDDKLDISPSDVKVCSDTCTNAVVIKCGDTATVSMKTNPFKAQITPASKYTCPIAGGSYLYGTSTAATELYMVLSGINVTTGTVTISAPGKETGNVFVLTDCTAKDGAFSLQQCVAQATFYTTKTGIAKAAVLSNVKVGSHVFAVDSSVEIDKVTVTATCK